MIQIKKNNVVIPIKTWNELKENDFFKDLIEVLEDSELLEKTKKESKGFIDLDDYIRNREVKENMKSKEGKKNGKKNLLSV